MYVSVAFVLCMICCRRNDMAPTPYHGDYTLFRELLISRINFFIPKRNIDPVTVLFLFVLEFFKHVGRAYCSGLTYISHIYCTFCLSLQRQKTRKDLHEYESSSADWDLLMSIGALHNERIKEEDATSLQNKRYAPVSRSFKTIRLALLLLSPPMGRCSTGRTHTHSHLAACMIFPTKHSFFWMNISFNVAACIYRMRVQSTITKIVNQALTSKHFL